MLLSSTGIIQPGIFSATTQGFSNNRLPRFYVTCASSTLYDRLQLPPDVDISDIKYAYRQLARRYHPDVSPAGKAEEYTRRFIEIQEAYDTLSDPRQKAVYDSSMARGIGSSSSVKMPWRSSDKDFQPSEWRMQWESQLEGLRQRSAMKAQRADSWSARVRRQNGLQFN